MGVAAQAGHALAAACTARSTSWWPESGTRERTDPSPGLKTSMGGSAAEAPPGEPAMTLWTAGYFILQRYRNIRTTNSNSGNADLRGSLPDHRGSILGELQLPGACYELWCTIVSE